MSKSYIPDHIGTIFDPEDYRNNDDYIVAEGNLATSTALVTNFTGEIDIRENLEFTSSEPVNNYIANVNKITFKDSIADQTVIIQEVDGLHITSTDIVLNNLPIKATVDDISQNVTDLQNQVTSYDLSINLIQTQSDRQDTSLNALQGSITINYNDITDIDTILGLHDTSLNEIKSIADGKTDISDHNLVVSNITNLQTKDSQIDSSLNIIISNIGSNDTDITNLQTKDTQIDSSLNSIITSLGNNDSDILNLQTKDSQIDSSLNIIISNIGSNDTDITNLQTKDTQIDSSLNSIITSLGNNDTDITNLQSKDTQIDSSLNSIITNIGNNDSDILNLQNKDTQIDSSLNSIITNIGNNDSDILNLQSKDTQIDSSLNDIITNVNTNSSDITTIQNSLGDINRYGSDNINIGASQIYVKCGHLDNASSGTRLQIKVLSGQAFNNTAYYATETSELTIINVVVCNNQENADQNIRFTWHNENDNKFVLDTVTRVAFHETSEKNYDLYIYFQNAWMNASITAVTSGTPLTMYDNFVAVTPPSTNFYESLKPTTRMTNGSIRTSRIDPISGANLHCRNVAGVILYNNTSASSALPLYHSCPNLSNPYNQTYTTGNTNLDMHWVGQPKGEWATISWANIVSRVVLLPGYSIECYSGTNYSQIGSDLILNVTNNEDHPIIVAPNSADQNEMESIIIFYEGIML